MSKWCCVPKCTNTTKKGEKLFSVPTGKKNASKREKWLSIFGKSASLYKDLRICSKHFCKGDFDVGMRFSTTKDLRLKHDALPHLYLGIKEDTACNYGIEKEEDSCSTQSNIQLKSEPQDVKYEIPSDGDDTYFKLEPVSEELHIKEENDVMVEEIEYTRETPFQCYICNNRFTAKSTLQQHIRTHTGEKPFQCNVCDYKCTQQGNLQQHMKTHTSEKPFQCNICENKFTLKGNLKQHMKKHTGEKPFQCSMCNYKCIQKISLQRHTKKHTGENLSECNICHKKFTSKYSLLNHVKIHISEQRVLFNIWRKKTHLAEEALQYNLCTNEFSEKGKLQLYKRTYIKPKTFQCICDHTYAANHKFTHCKLISSIPVSQFTK